MFKITLRRLVAAIVLWVGIAGSRGATADRQVLPGNLPPPAALGTPLGSLPETNLLYVSIGLPLHNEPALEELLRQIYDPGSTNYHKYLTPQEFTARFGPTEQDYQAVVNFAQANGLSIAGRHPNRLVLDVQAPVANVEQAFQVKLHTYRHPTEARNFFAPDASPSVPTNVPVADMWGLSDFGRPHPLVVPASSVKATPENYNGSGPGGTYRGGDFRNAYVPGTSLAGSGQTAAVAEFDGYYASDITNYEAQIGYTNVPLKNVYVDGVSGTPGYSGVANADVEVSLDIELLISMAPALSNLIVYEGNSPYDVFEQIVSDNVARQISCSWSFSYGPTAHWTFSRHSTLDSQLMEMDVQGQSFFVASGDADAYTGAQALSSLNGPIPVDSIYVTSVGGTSLNMNGGGSGWSSETVWNWGSNIGTSGGVSSNYPIPAWQTNVSMAFNNGSTANRNLPDVALTADAVTVDYGNGSNLTVGGTSCAAPLWAGFCALANQQAAAFGNGTNNVGFLNPVLYAIAAGAGYNACFHDITTGNNIGNYTAGLYYATNGYDLCTGLGTPNGTNLINALAPPPIPYFLGQPLGQVVINGARLTLKTAVAGQALLSYHWLYNGIALAGANVFGTNTSTLTLTNFSSANAGGYSVIVTNNYGAITSVVASVTVVYPPALASQPASQIVWAGSNAVFGVTATGTVSLAYQWLKSGTNLVNGSVFSGVNTSQLTVAAVATNSNGNFDVVVSNPYGSVTSSVAVLTVVQPPVITTPVAAQTVECTSNASFAVAAAATPAPAFQWSEDGAAILHATNTSLTLTNIHLPSHVISVVVTNFYGSASNVVTLTVQDTKPPVLTLYGANLIYVELGNPFTDPGASATDACAGAEAVIVTGTVNTNVPGTNILVYQASDGSGNTASLDRTVIVRDTTPPVIQWSFTNLVLAAGSNCAVPMPNVTGTNFILATDLSGPPVITQSPSTNTSLSLGSTTVILTATDTSGNAAYSTNTILVQDQTPPVINSEPQSVTNNIGGAASFTLTATACTPLNYQWYYNSGLIAGETNASLTLANVGLTNAGSYFVVATAAGGSTTSSVALLSVVSPPVVLWSFTNLVLAAGTNCAATMPDVTGTNYVQATVWSGTPVISQNPLTNSLLPIGTNLVVLAVSDSWSNTVYSTNTIVVADQTPPVMADEPSSVTNHVGDTVNFSLTATACTPLAYQWFFNTNLLAGQTNFSLTLFDVTTTDAGNYFAVATAVGGSTTSSVAVLTINGSSTTVMPATIVLSVTDNPGGGFLLTATGPAAAVCILEMTADLSVNGWLPLFTNDFGTNGMTQFVDTSATNVSQRFYRARLGP